MRNLFDDKFPRGGYEIGVRSREVDSAPLARLPPKLSPHTLPILLIRKLNYEALKLQVVCVTREVRESYL